MFFFLWNIAQQYHEKIVYILLVASAIVNVFQLYLATGLSF